MSLCWLIFRAGNSWQTRGNKLWNECERTKRAESFFGWKHAILLNTSLESTSIFVDTMMSLCLFNLYGWNFKCIYKTSKIHHPPSPVTLPLPHLGPFLFSSFFPLPMTFSPFVLPYMPKICSIASNLFVFMEIQIFHILPGGSLSVQNNHTFYADFYTPRQYKLQIRYQCIPMRTAVIFTAHTLWHTT